MIRHITTCSVSISTYTRTALSSSLLGLLLTVGTPCAWARATWETMPDGSGSPRTNRPYWSFMLGQANLGGDASLMDRSLAGNGFALSARSFDRRDFAMAGRLGFQFARYVGVEFGYVDLGQSRYRATTTSGTVTGTASGTRDYRGFTAAALFYQQLDEDFSLFAKFGLVKARINQTIDQVGANGLVTSNATFSKDTRPMVGVGISLFVTDYFRLRAEYERYIGLGQANTTGKSSPDLFGVSMTMSF